MNKSLEALNKMIEKYDWVGKEYCRLIGKNESLHKVNQEAFENLADTIKQDLERKEQLEKENQELRDKLHQIKNTIKNHSNETEKFVDELWEENFKYINAIEILKNNLFIEFDDDCRIIHLKDDRTQICDYTLLSLNKQDYQLLKEVLEYDKH